MAVDPLSPFRSPALTGLKPKLTRPYPQFLRKEPERFSRSREGRRVILLGVGLLFIALSMGWQNLKRRMEQQDPGAAPAAAGPGGITLPAVPTHLPAAFVPNELRHRLRTVTDRSDWPDQRGLGAVFDHLAATASGAPPVAGVPDASAAAAGETADPEASAGGAAAPEAPGGPAPVYTTLRPEEAVAGPDLFRGGLVTFNGYIMSVWPENREDTPNPEDVTYRAVLVETPKSDHGGVIVALAEKPSSDWERSQDRATVRGVFLQTITFRTMDEKTPTRVVPFMVARTLDIERHHGPTTSFLERAFWPITLTLGAAIVLTTVLAVRQWRDRKAGSSWLHVRAPGPRKPAGPRAGGKTSA